MPIHDAVRTQLQERLDQLLGRVGKIQDDLRSPHDRDWQERASEQENDQVLEGLDEMSRDEVGQILAALQRIDDGSYGLCSVCGAPIGAARLRALPSTATCVGCAS